MPNDDVANSSITSGRIPEATSAAVMSSANFALVVVVSPRWNRTAASRGSETRARTSHTRRLPVSWRIVSARIAVTPSIPSPGIRRRSRASRRVAPPGEPDVEPLRDRRQRPLQRCNVSAANAQAAVVVDLHGFDRLDLQQPCREHARGSASVDPDDERAVVQLLADRPVARHHDSLRALDHGAARERSLEVGVLGVAAKRDVDRALHLIGAPVDDVGEDAALRGLVDPGRIVRLEQRNHWTGRLAHDLGDHVERVLAADAEPHERQIRVLALGCGRHVRDLEFPRDHLVPEPGHDRRDALEPILALVRDQNAQQSSDFGHRKRRLTKMSRSSSIAPKIAA